MRLTKKKKILLVIALVIAILTTSVSLIITALNKDDGGDIITPVQKPIKYSVDVKSKFNRNLMIYVKQFINIDNVNKLGDLLLDAFSKSYISVKKVNDLGSYLASSKVDSIEMENYFLKFGQLDKDGNFKPHEGAEYLIAKELIKLPSVFKTVLLKVGFTNNEYASVCYEIILNNSSEIYRKALIIAPKDDILLLLSNGLEMFEILSDFTENVKNKQIADSFQEGLFEFGSNLKSTYSILGEENFSTLLGLNFRRETENLGAKEKLIAEEVNKTLILLKQIVDYSVNVSVNFMTKLPKNTISGFIPIEYPDVGIDYIQSQHFKYLSYLNIIKTFDSSLKNNFNEKVPSVLIFKAKLTSVFVQMIKLDNLSNDLTEDYIALENEINEEMSKHFNASANISQKYASINTYEDIKNLTNEEFNSLKTEVDMILDFAPVIKDNADSVFRFLMVNIYNSIFDAYRNIDKKE